MYTTPIDADYCALTEEIESIHEASKFKGRNRVSITRYKSIISKVYTINWWRKIFVIDSVLKTNPWTHEIKDLEEKKIRSFYKKNCCLLNYKWAIIQNQIVILKTKVKLLLDLPNYSNKKGLKHVKGVDISNLDAKKILLF